MARYLVTSGSRFEPFTYDELAAPIQQFTDAQNAAAEKYDELNVQTQALANYIDQTNDPHAWEMYNNYMTQLQTLQDNLWNKGYNAGTVRDLTNARGLYARDMSRIQKAIEARQERAADWAKRTTDDPSLFTSYNPGTASLDKYIANDNYGLDWRSYSGNALAKEGDAIGKSLAQRIYDNEGWYRSILGDQYYDQILNYGIHPNDINSATEKYIAGQKTSDNPMEQLIMDAIDQVYNASGMPEWADDTTREQAIRRIREGLSSAEGQTHVDIIANPAAKPTSNGSSGSGNDIVNPKDYRPSSVISNLWNQAGAKTNAVNDENFGPVRGGERPVSTTSETENGDVESSTRMVRNQTELTELTYHPPYVDKVIDKYRIDPRYGGGRINSRRQNGRIVLSDGSEIPLQTAVLSKSKAEEIGMENIPDNPIDVQRWNSSLQRWETDKDATLEVNEAKYKYQQNLKDFRRNNPDFKRGKGILNKDNRLKNNTLTPGEERRIRRRRGVESDVDWRNLMYTQEPGAINEQEPTIDIVSNTPDQDELAEFFINNMYQTVGNSVDGGKQSAVRLFPIKDGVIQKNGVTLDSVFPRSDDSKNPVKPTHFSISVRPGDLENDMFRVQVNGKPYAIHSSMLGTDMYKKFNDKVYVETSTDEEGKGGFYSLKDIMSIASAPIYNPTRVMNMDRKTLNKNTELAFYLLGDNYPLKYVGTDSNGEEQYAPYTLLEIIYDDTLFSQFKEGIRATLIDAITTTNDMWRNFPMRFPSGTGELTYARP